MEGLAGWGWNPHTDAWEEAFQRLEQYVARKGDARVTRHILEDGFPLGMWVSRQREKHRNDQLTSEQVRRFESLLGWEWSPATGQRPPKPQRRGD